MECTGLMELAWVFLEGWNLCQDMLNAEALACWGETSTPWGWQLLCRRSHVSSGGTPTPTWPCLQQIPPYTSCLCAKWCHWMAFMAPLFLSHFPPTEPFEGGG